MEITEDKEGVRIPFYEKYEGRSKNRRRNNEKVGDKTSLS